MKYHKIIFGLGMLFGMGLTNVIWYLRLIQGRFLKEMIFYLNQENLSLFLGFAFIDFFLFTIGLFTYYYFTRKWRKRNDKNTNNN